MHSLFSVQMQIFQIAVEFVRVSDVFNRFIYCGVAFMETVIAPC